MRHIVAIVLSLISFIPISYAYTPTPGLVERVQYANQELQPFLQNMQHDGVNQVIELFHSFQLIHQNDQQKSYILDTLLSHVLDTYYGVIDFRECQIYFNGCNTCGVKNDMIHQCTEMACFTLSQPRCDLYVDGTTPKDRNIGICPERIDEDAACIALYEPVCGNDHKTYGNGCSACNSGKINAFIDGEC